MKSNRVKVKLTEKLIENLKPEPGKQTREVFDDLPGVSFWVRAYTTGMKAFYCRGGQDRKARKLGTYGKSPGFMTLAEARAQAVAVAGQHAQGEEVLTLVPKKSERKTMDDLFDDFIAARALQGLRPRSLGNYRWIYAQIAPLCGKREPRLIDQDDVKALMDAFAGGPNPRPFLANRVQSLLSGMFNHALGKRKTYSVKFNPATMRNKAKPVADERERARTRRLDREGIRLLWEVLELQPLRIRAIFKLFLWTGARSGELLGMQWREIDFDAAVWTIPPSRTKNRGEHRAPLPDEALDLLRKLRDDQDRSCPFVFPGPVVGENPGPVKALQSVKRTAASLARAMTNLRRQGDPDAEPLTFSCHDLRRSLASSLALLEVPQEHRALMLNHRDRTVTNAYTGESEEVKRAQDAIRRRVLNRWVAELNRITTGKAATVVSIAG